MAKDTAEDTDEDATENEPEMRLIEVVSLTEVEPHFNLGAKQSKPLVIKDLQTHGPAFDQVFMSFCSRISIAINEMSPEPTHVVLESQEVSMLISIYCLHPVSW